MQVILLTTHLSLYLSTLGAFGGVYQGCRRVNYLSKTSAVPTIWAKCFALTKQKFNKGRTKPNLSPNGDRSGYKFRSVQGRGQAFFGETSWNGTRGKARPRETGAREHC